MWPNWFGFGEVALEALTPSSNNPEPLLPLLEEMFAPIGSLWDRRNLDKSFLKFLQSRPKDPETDNLNQLGEPIATQALREFDVWQVDKLKVSFPAEVARLGSGGLKIECPPPPPAPLPPNTCAALSSVKHAHTHLCQFIGYEESAIR
jgi:hypothetical protein